MIEAIRNVDIAIGANSDAVRIIEASLGQGQTIFLPADAGLSGDSDNQLCLQSATQTEQAQYDHQHM
jgi:hypothetical protein